MFFFVGTIFETILCKIAQEATEGGSKLLGEIQSAYFCS